MVTTIFYEKFESLHTKMYDKSKVIFAQISSYEKTIKTEPIDDYSFPPCLQPQYLGITYLDSNKQRNPPLLQPQNNFKTKIKIEPEPEVKRRKKKCRKCKKCIKRKLRKQRKEEKRKEKLIKFEQQQEQFVQQQKCREFDSKNDLKFPPIVNSLAVSQPKPAFER